MGPHPMSGRLSCSPWRCRHLSWLQHLLFFYGDFVENTRTPGHDLRLNHWRETAGIILDPDIAALRGRNSRIREIPPQVLHRRPGSLAGLCCPTTAVRHRRSPGDSALPRAGDQGQSILAIRGTSAGQSVDSIERTAAG